MILSSPDIFIVWLITVRSITQGNGLRPPSEWTPLFYLQKPIKEGGPSKRGGVNRFPGSSIYN